MGGHGRTGVVSCSLFCLLYPWLARLPAELTRPWIMRSPVPETQEVEFGIFGTFHCELRDQHPDAFALASGAVALFNRFHAEREDEQGGGCSRFPHSFEQLAQVVRVAGGLSASFASLPRATVEMVTPKL